MARIVFDITGQGYGHLSQIGPVIKEVRALSPQTTIIVGSHFPEEALTRFAGAPIERRLPPPEASVVTVGPMRFDSQATIATYRELHSDFPALVRSEASRLALVKPDLLVAASSYVSLAAASRLEIPTVALGSFSWLDAFEAYCSEMPEAGRIAAEIEAAYSSATIFLHPRPHVAPRFANALSIGPIGRIGLDLRAEVRRLIGVPPHVRLALVSLGSIPNSDPLTLPSAPDVHWILQGGGAVDGQDHVTDIASLPYSFIDVLASMDVVVTKDGYGTVVEAACNGVGLVLAPRPKWPEAAPFAEWGRANCAFAVLDRLGDPERLLAVVRDVLSMPVRPRLEPTGVREAAEAVLGALRHEQIDGTSSARMRRAAG